MKRTLVLLSLFAVPLAADAATVMLPALPGYHEAGAWNKRPPRNFCDCTGCEHCRPGCRCQ